MDDVRVKREEVLQFLDTVLRPELKKCEALEKTLDTEIEAYQALSQQLQSWQPSAQTSTREEPKLMGIDEEPSTKTKNTSTTVDLGHGKVFCRAQHTVGAATRVFVHAGLGFHIELDSQQEAPFLCSERVKFLRDCRRSHARDATATVKVHVQQAEQLLAAVEAELALVQESSEMEPAHFQQ